MSARFKLSHFALAASVLLAPAGAFAEVKGNAERGEDLYEECSGCHSLTEHKIGPKHCGVVGSPAASQPDFNYSDAMRESEIVWNDEHLHEFLKSPFTYVSGTMMGFVGLHDEQDRADIIAYLREASENPEICGDAQ